MRILDLVADDYERLCALFLRNGKDILYRNIFSAGALGNYSLMRSAA